MNKKLRISLIIISAIGLLIAGILFFLPIPSPNSWTYSRVIRDENNKLLRVYLDDNEQWHLEYKDQIPDKLKKAILTYEDKDFYNHFGISFTGILRALKQNISEQKVVSGGSTITMQVARIYGQRDRTVFNKSIEMLQAVKMEMLYSKEDILRMYLNNAPYGSNIVGISSASYKYYQKDLTELTWAEACLFAVLPNNPGYLYPGSNTDKLKNKRDKLLLKLYNEGIITELQYKTSFKESISSRIYRFPLHAPHFCDYVNRNNKNVEQTSLSLDIQKTLENNLNTYKYFLHSQGIKNLAILVTDTQTQEVKAYVGSHDYLDDHLNGPIDGVQAQRSTGSVLKPFIYGYCFEKGIITPESLIEDVEMGYSINLPKNYNDTYMGVVKAKRALQKSLNIPAYFVTQELGLQNTLNVLTSVGMKSLDKKADHYGLSICIGGAEVSLWNLSEMYLTLANQGIHRSLKYYPKQEQSQSKSLLSPASCWQVLDILEGIKRPRLITSKKVSNIRFSWKTGTSNGFRDAWAVGSNKKWTIAVWCGNFTGEGNPNLIGSTIAGRILFETLENLDNNGQLVFPYPNASFKTIPICAETGYSITKSCEDTLWYNVPKSSFILPKCPYHKTIIVNEDSTMQVCSKCWQGIKTNKMNVLDYPANIDYTLVSNGDQVPFIPPHKKDCPSILGEENSFTILYPKHGHKIYLPIDSSGRVNSFRAIAHCNDMNESLYWYLDKKYLGKTDNSHELDIVTRQGQHDLLLINQDGVEKRVSFNVIRKKLN